MRTYFLDVSPDKDCDVDECFYHLQQAIFKFQSGVGDVINTVIMKNNRIENILIFHEKAESEVLSESIR